MSTADKTLAHPPGACCVTTVKHEGIPAGQAITLGPLRTYISEPITGTSATTGTAAGKKKNVILFLSDIHGSFFINNQLLQDHFASHGYTVLGPDYLFGDSVMNHNQEIMKDDLPAGVGEWIHSLVKPANEAFPAWLAAVHAKWGAPTITNYFAVGYCFGGPFTLNLAATNDVVAAAISHPTYLNESHFQKVKKPLFISCAEHDPLFPLDSRRRAEDILIEEKAIYHFQVFSGVWHGFAVRGDLSDENTRWAKETSASGIVGWFERFTV